MDIRVAEPCAKAMVKTVEDVIHLQSLHKKLPGLARKL